MIKRLLKVEIADTPSKHQQGLMFRNKLGEEEGMLFKFRSSQNLRFWGLNTFIPLAIAFVSSDNKIKKIGYISPNSTSAICSDDDCDKAIEANYDFFSKNNIGVGDSIKEIEENGSVFVKFE